MSNLSISRRAASVPSSPIRKLTAFADEAKAKGIKIYHLNVGQPDLPSPREFYDGLKKYSEKTVAYAPANGRKELLEGWKKFYNKKGFSFDINNIVITSGGAEAIIFALLALCDDGDEVIVFEPFYTSYAMFAAMLGVKLVPVTLSIHNGFHIGSEIEIEKKISPKTKAIMICNPNNPTGTVYEKEELDRLVNVVRKHNLFLLSDETYQEIVFDKKHVVSFSRYPEIKDHLVIVDSLSKRLNICGARLGCIASCNTDVMKSVTLFAQARLSAGTIEQAAVAPLFLESESYIQETVREWEKRRDAINSGLSKITGVVFRKPEGAFYVIAGLPLEDADDFAKYLLTDFSDHGETVMVAPASGFYRTPGLGKNEIRIAYVLSPKKLERAMELLGLAIVAYRDAK